VFYSAPTGLLLWLIHKIIVLVATYALQKEDLLSMSIPERNRLNKSESC
jgi:hypothetical protein